MKIVLANDHHGIDLKKKVFDYLNVHNIEYINLGCDEKNNVDYVDYAKMLCECIREGKADYGILICGTGIGMSIAANKMNGIIAAKVNTPREAMLCKEHNMANVITLAEYTENLEEILENFIYTQPSNEERHVRRLEKINNLE